MKKIASILIISVLFLAAGCTSGNRDIKSAPISTVSKSEDKNLNNNTATDSANEASQNTKGTNSTVGQKDNSNTVEKNNAEQADTSEKNTTTIKVFLIAIDDNGKSGKRIGTGDSVIPVTRTIPYTEAPLAGALKELFSSKDWNYGQSGLYNSLYQSSLKLETAKIINGVAVINITGKLMLGGAMDNPRVKAQITETARQFPTVKDVNIFINGKTIDDVLSLK